MLTRIRGWVGARIVLGWALAKHLALIPWAKRRSGPKRWLTQMGKEALGRTPAANWAHLAGSSRCVGCGLCDLFGSPALPRPSVMILGAARLPSDAPRVAPAALAELRRLAPRIAGICPVGVDSRDIVALIENNCEALANPVAAGIDA